MDACKLLVTDHIRTQTEKDEIDNHKEATQSTAAGGFSVLDSIVVCA